MGRNLLLFLWGEGKRIGGGARTTRGGPGGGQPAAPQGSKTCARGGPARRRAGVRVRQTSSQAGGVRWIAIGGGRANHPSWPAALHELVAVLVLPHVEDLDESRRALTARHLQPVPDRHLHAVVDREALVIVVHHDVEMAAVAHQLRLPVPSPQLAAVCAAGWSPPAKRERKKEREGERPGRRAVTRRTISSPKHRPTTAPRVSGRRVQFFPFHSPFPALRHSCDGPNQSGFANRGY